MNNSYLLGIASALVLVVIGVLLIGRDGTEEPQTGGIIENAVPGAVIDLLPSDANTNTAENIIPDLESELDDDNSTSSATLPDEETSDTGIVTYTSSGFDPKTITVRVGDTVTFINNGSRNMWVASNVHPTHNAYPEKTSSDCLGSSFDACEGIKENESWSFTFNKVGEWGYHNHLSSSRTGTVIVEE